jgi:hypothetical protein
MGCLDMMTAEKKKAEKDKGVRKKFLGAFFLLLDRHKEVLGWVIQRSIFYI